MWDTSQVIYTISILLFVCSVVDNLNLAISTTDTHERFQGVPISKGIRVSLTFMQVNDMEHHILVFTDLHYRENATATVKFRCLGGPVMFCDKNWKEIQDCKRIQSNSVNGFISYICMLNQGFIVLSTLEIQATVKIGNLSAVKTRNFSIGADNLGLITDLRGEGTAVDKLLLKWTNGHYPAVVWEFEKQVKQKTVKVKYWERIHSLKTQEEDFHVGFRQNKTSLNGLQPFTEYCFQAKYSFKFEFGNLKGVKPGYVIELGWSGWSKEACAWTLGVPSESFKNFSCKALRTSNGSLLHLKYKLPPKPTWNGVLDFIQMRIFSVSMITTRTTQIAPLSTNCSRTLKVELTSATHEEIHVDAALCTKGGCSGTTLSRCRWLGISLSNNKTDFIEVMFPGVVGSLILIVLAAIGVLVYWIKRHKGRKPSTVTFDTVIEPVNHDYDKPVDPPHVYHPLKDIVSTSCS